MNNDKKFLDLDVNVFKNKNNGQLTVTLPRRKLMKMFDEDDLPKITDIPKKIPIRFFKWRNK